MTTKLSMTGWARARRGRALGESKADRRLNIRLGIYDRAVSRSQGSLDSSAHHRPGSANK